MYRKHRQNITLQKNIFLGGRSILYINDQILLTNMLHHTNNDSHIIGKFGVK